MNWYYACTYYYNSATYIIISASIKDKFSGFSEVVLGLWLLFHFLPFFMHGPYMTEWGPVYMGCKELGQYGQWISAWVPQWKSFWLELHGFQTRFPDQQFVFYCIHNYALSSSLFLLQMVYCCDLSWSGNINIMGSDKESLWCVFGLEDYLRREESLM